MATNVPRPLTDEIRAKGQCPVPPPPPPPGVTCGLNAHVDVRLIRRLAAAITARMFTTHDGGTAERLVLVDDERDGKPSTDYGGYCRESFDRHVRLELAAVLFDHMANGANR